MLQLFEGGDLDKALRRYSPDCVYRSPLIEVRGTRGVLALFSLGRALPVSVRARRPVRVAVWDRPAEAGGGEIGAGTEVLIDHVLEIAPLPLLPRFLRLHCVSSLVLDAEGRVLLHSDAWRPLDSLCESFPPVRRFYRSLRRLVGGFVGQLLCLAFPSSGSAAPPRQAPSRNTVKAAPTAVGAPKRSRGRLELLRDPAGGSDS